MTGAGAGGPGAGNPRDPREAGLSARTGSDRTRSDHGPVPAEPRYTPSDRPTISFMISVVPP